MREHASGGEPVRVLIACDHIDFHGALHGGGRQLIELTRALLGTHIEPTVCIMRGASALGAELVAEGLPFQFFGDGRLSPMPLPRLLRIIRRRRIDVLHLTDFSASTFGRLAGAIAGVPSVVQIISNHSDGEGSGFPLPVELAYRALASRTDCAVAISQSVRDFAVRRMGFAPSQVEVLHCPLPSHSFRAPSPEEISAVRASHGIGEGDLVIGAVTRFFASKGIVHLIEAFARLRASGSGAWLVLVGQGMLEGDLRARARDLRVEDRVIFAGFQRQAHIYTGMFDVAVTPSLMEGFGLVALEAMALGVPVVATRVGGLPEVVTDERTGLLVPPADSGALAQAIGRLLDSSALRRTLGEQGRAEARRFSLDVYVSRLIEIYSGLAAGRSLRATGIPRLTPPRPAPPAVSSR